MRLDERADAAKLRMLEALAQSQHAVVRLMEQAADTAAELHLPAALFNDQLRLLAVHQGILIEKLSGLEVRRPRRGTPLHPWLSPELTRLSAAINRNVSIRRQIRKEGSDRHD